MKLLITGARGQLGSDLLRVGRARGDDVVAFGRSELDVTDRDTVLRRIEAAAPDVVVNCAAFTAVDACEEDTATAMAVNADAVGHLRGAAERVGAHLVQVSTDYVFDGRLDRPYREDDAPHPESVYGRSKLSGEEQAGPSSTIVRTSWLSGEHGPNIVRTVLHLADEGRRLAFVDDQRGCPTFTSDLAPAIHHLATERAGGIWHLTNARAVSWYEFVREVLGAAGLEPDLVRPITTDELDPPRPAPRPANGELENAAWRAAGLPPLRDHAEPLAELVAVLRP